MATKAFVNVVNDFGADPTGAADSTAAFNAAVASLPAGGGGIEVPPGTYTINEWTPTKSGVVLRGAGMFATTLQGSTAGNFILKIANIARWSVSDITFDANKVKQSALTIAGSVSTGNTLFTHCYFRGATQDTLRLGNVGGSDDVSFNLFFACIFDSNAPSNSQIRVAGSNTAQNEFKGGSIGPNGSVARNVDFQDGQVKFSNVYLFGATQYDFVVAAGSVTILSMNSESSGGFFHSLPSDQSGYDYPPHSIHNAIIASPVYLEAMRTHDLQNIVTNHDIRLGANAVVDRTNIRFWSTGTWVYDSPVPKTRTAPLARFWLTASQSIPKDTPTAVPWDVQSFNVGAHGIDHLNAVNPSQIKIKRCESGYYRISAKIEWGGPGGAEVRITVNGAMVSRGVASVDDVVFLKDNDVVSIVVVQSTGVPQNVVGGNPYNSFVTVERID